MDRKEAVKIKCQDCGEDFIFTVNDQIFYEEKGFLPPKRCKNCRNARKDRQVAYNNRNKKY